MVADTRREREAHQWTVSRSDGKVQPRSIKSATGVRVPVPLEDPAYERWEFLAGNALRDMFYKPDHRLAGSDFFVEFPGNYEIYFEARAGKKDYYLYGHPSGDSYKAARDFVPHLFWLTTGSVDIRDCQCTLCKRSATEHARAASSGATKKKSSKSTAAKAAASGSSSGTPVPTPAVPATLAAAPVTATNTTPVPAQASVPAQAPAAASDTAPQARPAATAAPSQPAPQQEARPGPAQSTPSTAAPAAPQQQRIPPPEPVIFRDGEVVWYKNGPSWRIGMIFQTVVEDAASGTRAHCLVKPLAHSALPTTLTPKVEEDMRPFLAFSVPDISPGLVSLQDQYPHQIDWKSQQAQIAGDNQQRRDILGMEASKLAVIYIDDSYSTFNRQSVPEPTATRSFYGGVFLGAERLTAGEAVRIRLGPQEAMAARPNPIVLSIKAIFVDSTSGADQLFFYGDVLWLEEVPISQPPPEYSASLPAVLIRERAFRDRVRAPAGVRHDWVPVPGCQSVMKGERDVRGRFYETERLMKIIDPDRLQASIASSVVVDVQQYLNGRLENQKRKYIGRRKNRSDVMVGAVTPDNLPLSFGPGVIED